MTLYQATLTLVVGSGDGGSYGSGGGNSGNGGGSYGFNNNNTHDLGATMITTALEEVAMGSKAG